MLHMDNIRLKQPWQSTNCSFNLVPYQEVTYLEKQKVSDRILNTTFLKSHSEVWLTTLGN